MINKINYNDFIIQQAFKYKRDLNNILFTAAGHSRIVISMLVLNILGNQKEVELSNVYSQVLNYEFY